MADTANLLLRDTRRSVAGNDGEYENYLSTFVQELRGTFSVRTGKGIDDSDLLRVLHPATNTLGYIFLLNNLTLDHTSDLFMISLVAFLTQYDAAQARYAGPEWRRILDMTADLVHATQNLDLLTPYRAAILRIDPTSCTLTTNHLLYVELCLQAQRPREALPILDRDVMNVPYDKIQGVDQGASPHEIQDYITTESGISGEVSILVVQEYYLLGAQIYIGLRNYDRASLFLELVLSTPGAGNPVNSFMVEAYKKLILVNLVWRGRPPSLSHIVEAPVQRTLNQIAKVYEVLSECFKSRNLAKFDAEVDAAATVLSDEGNMGLANATAQALRRWRVLDLQRHYAAMPVELVATHLGMSPAAALHLLQVMIQDGYLQASIAPSKQTSQLQNGASSAASSTVRFHAWDKAGAPSTTTDSAEEQIKARLARIEALSAAVREADRRFSLSREYGDWLRRNKRAGDAGALAYEDPMEMDAGFEERDEDIMAT